MRVSVQPFCYSLPHPVLPACRTTPPTTHQAAGTLAAASETLQEIVGDDPLFYEAAFQLGMSVVIQSTLRKISANQRIQVSPGATEIGFAVRLASHPPTAGGRERT